MKKWILSGVVLFAATANAALPVGELEHDGPPTPEQLSLLLPVTGALTNAATATVRYRQISSADFVEGHPLFRIRPDHTSTSGAFSTVAVTDDFAWPIIDLLPGVTYEVEVTVSDAVETEIRTGVFTTRALPGPAGAVTTTIAAGSSQSQIQSIFNSAAPGDVIEFENGVYDLGGNDIEITSLAGTAAQPIYVRGASREGVVLRNGTPRTFYFIEDTRHVIFENMTLEGRGRDNGISPTAALQIFQDADGSSHLTFRNLTLVGHDQVIRGMRGMQSFLIYDNTFGGNNAWDQDLYAQSGSGAPGGGDGTLDINQNLFWNDDGINMPGFGHAVFNNTVRGFGDSLSFCSHAGSNATAECRGIHFYRNDIFASGDDCAELDYAFRNVSMYDNRCINGMTAVSLDNGYGGPFLAARNIFVNIGRSAYKFNGTVSGHFVYNNTLIITANREGFGWVQFNNGANRSWGYRNNLFIYQNAQGPTYVNEASVHNPIDFTHNSWFPDSRFVWNNSGGSGNSLGEAFANLPATTPVFSGQTERHFADTIVEAQPFVSPVTLPSGYETRFDELVTPQIASASSAAASGVSIPNITDGHTGGLPDRGAIVAGRPMVSYGDRSLASGLPPTVDLSAAPTTVDPGQSTVLTWSSTNATACSASGGWSGSRATTNSAGESSVALTQDTQFTLTCTGAGGSTSDSVSVVVTSPVPAPTVSLSATPAVIESGETVLLTWSSTDATSCTASGGWNGARETQNQAGENSGMLTADTRFVLTCTGPGGTASDGANVSVSSIPDPTVSLVASATSVDTNGSVTLTWTTMNAVFCQAGSSDNSQWFGSRDVAGGTQVITNITQDTAYNLDCINRLGVRVNSGVNVTVNGVVDPPTVTLSAIPNPVVSGGAVTLSWNSANTTSCEASGDWSGSRGLSGSETISDLMQAQSYLLTCTGPGGGSSAIVNVVVTPVGVTVSLTASPASVTEGGSVTLTWASTGATTCSAGGDWSGAKDLSGAQTIDGLTQDQSYTLTCTGAGGDGTDSASVVVTAAPVPPTVDNNSGGGGGGGAVSLWTALVGCGWWFAGLARRRYSQPL